MKKSIFITAAIMAVLTLMSFINPIKTTKDEVKLEEARYIMFYTSPHKSNTYYITNVVKVPMEYTFSHGEAFLEYMEQKGYDMETFILQKGNKTDKQELIDYRARKFEVAKERGYNIIEVEMQYGGNENFISVP